MQSDHFIQFIYLCLWASQGLYHSVLQIVNSVVILERSHFFELVLSYNDNESWQLALKVTLLAKDTSYNFFKIYYQQFY